MATQVQLLLFDWWRQQGRVLPWREKTRGQPRPVSAKFSVRDAAFADYFASDTFRDPYRVVVAELMLQQTQVERVLPKYLAWMSKWSTAAALAAASLPEVLGEWQGLGYNRRARFLWLLAQEIAVRRGGQWPRTEKELLQLPGIGPYTARAILCFAFGQQVGVVDTNVQRIFERVFGVGGKSAELFAFADKILPLGQADPWNQAIMDFGALVCTARAPQCQDCPLSQVCQANLAAHLAGFINYAEQLAAQPAKKRAAATPFKDTNRFFRGRIVDILRNGPITEQQLAKQMSEEFGLQTERFQQLLAKLTSEQMLEVQYGRVGLAGSFKL